MNLPTEIFGEVIVVHTPEELSTDQAMPFRQFVTRLDRSRVVLDVDNTEFIDSAGLEALLEARDELHECGGDIRISTSNHINRKILEITRIDRHLEVFDSVIEAVKSYC